METHSTATARPLTALRDSLTCSLVEREGEVESILLGLISQQHVMLVGHPGTGKSHTCRLVAAGIADCRYCERLLAPGTPPEQLFGHLSIPELKHGKYTHVIDGSVADSHFVFLDEFFRGGDAIKDTLLHVLGPERQALIGTKQMRVPLRSAVGAANTWNDSASQAAILDRWLIRRTVHSVSMHGLERVMFEDFPLVSPAVSLADLDTASLISDSLVFTEDARRAVMEIICELRDAGIVPSDRRCRASMGVARAAAYLDGASEVLPHHLEPLQDCLWDDPVEQPEMAAEIVLKVANPLGAKIGQIKVDVAGIVASVKSAEDRMEAVRKLQISEKEIASLGAGGNGRADDLLRYVKRERYRIQASVLGVSMEAVERAEAMERERIESRRRAVTS